MAHRLNFALRAQTSPERLVRIRGVEKATLQAWADLDRFAVIDVSTDDEKGWAAVGVVGDPHTEWPPRPVKTPDKTLNRAIVTRIYVGCRPISRLETLLEQVFAGDESFAQTGLQPPAGPQRPGAQRERLTCRASFLVDADGRPQAESFGYAPLIDFARHLAKNVPGRSIRQVMRQGLDALDQYESHLLENWHKATESTGHMSPRDALDKHLEAVADSSDDPHRYLAVWVRVGTEPPGQLPAFYRADLLRASQEPTGPLARDYLAGRPGGTPRPATDVRATPAAGFGFVEPSVLPRSAWASDFLPRFSQQVALGGLLDRQSRVTAVNGPPGTGKTTLLRDVYAEVVAERASVMSEYDDPRKAFGAAEEVPGADGRQWFTRPVDARLTGFEMLVASSNNAAVQNVSTQLPGLYSVGKAYRDRLRYFRSATAPGPGPGSTRMERLTSQRNDEGPRAPATRPGLLPEDSPAWGLGAAVLGRRDLVARFGLIVGRYFGRYERGEHLLGQLHGGGTLEGWRAARAQFRHAVQALETRLFQLEDQRAQQGGRSALGRLLFGAGVPEPLGAEDPRRWGRWHTEPELGTAWVDDELQRLRAEVFIAAMAVHEQFARRAGEAMNDNLRLWLALQSGEIDHHHAVQVVLSAWQAFFLLVPLASTTFASMHRLLSGVPAGSLGWLVVDEAGQATPGSAVGGLARFRRAIIVGDPLQLEPVVTLPRQLVEQLFENRSAPPELAPHRASVQLMADAVTPYGTRRGGTWVGLPLLAHNRCQKPMFEISNAMAYEDTMVQGRAGGEAAGLEPLGPSRWIDVPRPEGSHFQPRDADVVTGLLARLPWGTAAAGPSIAVISPFRQVVRELSPHIEKYVRSLLPHDLAQEQLERILSAIGIGTVHTFQGQEYDAVILVLGGGSSGARRWAAATPNLLNVAVTRAKDRLYVIGDHGAWAQEGHAHHLAEGLPRVTADED